MCPSDGARTGCVLAVMAVMLGASHSQEIPGGSRVLAFQAEAAVGYNPRNIHWRSQAAGQQAVWLEGDGDSLEFAICLPRADQVHVTSVRFSSDGWMKEGSVVVDNEEVGTFFTVDNSYRGVNWNTFNTSSGSFQSTSLAEGRHVISVVMKHSMDNDPWGIEIDEVVLEFGSPYTLQDLTCPNDERLAALPGR
ncbi:uncharacterized protein [Littorina saxatilis]|uniref:uncharacterized protein n=1 Tax=Littorina saxatilis TaxID=31220 RepID=UPI0038B6264E